MIIRFQSTREMLRQLRIDVNMLKPVTFRIYVSIREFNRSIGQILLVEIESFCDERHTGSPICFVKILSFSIWKVR